MYKFHRNVYDTLLGLPAITIVHSVRSEDNEIDLYGEKGSIWAYSDTHIGVRLVNLVNERFVIAPNKDLKKYLRKIHYNADRSEQLRFANL